MKKTLKLMVIALLTLGLFSCGETRKKITVEELREAQSTLFNNGSLNEKEAPKVAEKYCRFVKQNPDDTASVKWLYHALEINVMLKNSEKSIEIGNQLLEQYHQSRWAPQTLLTLGSFVCNAKRSQINQRKNSLQLVRNIYHRHGIVAYRCCH